MERHVGSCLGELSHIITDAKHSVAIDTEYTMLQNGAWLAGG